MVSSLSQEIMCRFGQSVVFEEAASLINTLTGSDFNAKQVERICHFYGGLLESEQDGIIASGGSKEYVNQENNELHYVMMDGAMYPTREKENPWKEVKLGRVFKGCDLLYFSKNEHVISNSTYVAHLGNSRDFLSKLEYEIEGLAHPVFINDGAPWIWNWIDSTFPNSTQILDFYHAKEHLCEFAKEYFPDDEIRKAWIAEQSELLLHQTPLEVIDNIKSLQPRKKTNKMKSQLINYYTKNLSRMQYKAFKEKGLLIGSGAIEAAHKVYQGRFKKSGQHWSEEGLQKTMQLKSAKESKQWYKVVNIAKNAA